MTTTRNKQLALYIGAAFMALAVVVELWVISLGVDGVVEAARLRNGGEVARATVVNVERVERSGSRRRSSVTWAYEYEFTTPDGRTIRDRHNYGTATPPFRRGQVVEVLYLPSDPSRSRLRDRLDLDSNASTFLTLFMLGLTAATAWLAWWFIRSLRRDIRLDLEGVSTVATTTALEPLRPGRANSLVRASYEYVDQAGVSHTGRTGKLKPEQAERYQVGSQIGVRYLASRPAEHRLIPASGAVAA